MNCVYMHIIINWMCVFTNACVIVTGLWKTDKTAAQSLQWNPFKTDLNGGRSNICPLQRGIFNFNTGV